MDRVASLLPDAVCKAHRDAAPCRMDGHYCDSMPACDGGGYQVVMEGVEIGLGEAVTIGLLHRGGSGPFDWCAHALGRPYG